MFRRWNKAPLFPRESPIFEGFFLRMIGATLPGMQTSAKLRPRAEYKTLREWILHKPKRGKQLWPKRPLSEYPLIKLIDCCWPWECRGWSSNYPGRGALLAMIIGWASPTAATHFANGNTAGRSRIAYARAAAFTRAKIATLTAIALELEAIANAPPKPRKPRSK